jgi:hypothetical protein
MSLQIREVEHLHRAFGRDFDIPRLEIPMNDALFVRVIQRVCYLPHDSNRFIKRQRTVGRFAPEKFHHEVIRSDIVQRTNIRMIQCRNSTCLAIESFIEPLCRKYRLNRQARGFRMAPTWFQVSFVWLSYETCGVDYTRGIHFNGGALAGARRCFAACS